MELADVGENIQYIYKEFYEMGKSYSVCFVSILLKLRLFLRDTEKRLASSKLATRSISIYPLSC